MEAERKEDRREEERHKVALVFLSTGEEAGWWGKEDMSGVSQAKELGSFCWEEVQDNLWPFSRKGCPGPKIGRWQAGSGDAYFRCPCTGCDTQNIEEFLILCFGGVLLTEDTEHRMLQNERKRSRGLAELRILPAPAPALGP